MTDDTPRMPGRIWADRSDDDLPQYADTPFGIWWHDPRDGYAEYVRSDLYEAERQRAEKAEAEQDRLRSIIRILLDADERGQGVAWQNAMDMAQHAIERGSKQMTDRAALEAAITAYAPVRPDGTLWIDGMSDQPQTVFSNVVAFEGFPKGGWKLCEATGWRCIAVKVSPL